ncbi:hypothetical protein ACQP1U_05800 [Actinomycetota bacterium]
MTQTDDDWADDARTQEARQFFDGLRSSAMPVDRAVLDAAVRRATTVRRRRAVGGAIGGIGAAGLIAAAIAIGPGALSSAPVPPATGPSSTASAPSLSTSPTVPTATTSATSAPTGVPRSPMSTPASSSASTQVSSTPPLTTEPTTAAPTQGPISGPTSVPTSVPTTGRGAQTGTGSPASPQPPPSTPPSTPPAADKAVPIPASVFPEAAQMPWQMAPYFTLASTRTPIVVGGQMCNLGRESADRPQPTSGRQFHAISPDNAPDGAHRQAEIQLTVTRFATERDAATALQQTLANTGECLWTTTPGAWLPSATGSGSSTWAELNRPGDPAEVVVLERSGRVLVGGYLYTIHDNPADEATALVQRTLAAAVEAGLSQGAS